MYMYLVIPVKKLQVNSLQLRTQPIALQSAKLKINQQNQKSIHKRSAYMFINKFTVEPN